ncbi:MAG: hypothetical protein QW367_01975 [Candidatus Aenigmatarchaeota archaeon]
MVLEIEPESYQKASGLSRREFLRIAFGTAVLLFVESIFPPILTSCKPSEPEKTEDVYKPEKLKDKPGNAEIEMSYSTSDRNYRDKLYQAISGSLRGKYLGDKKADISRLDKGSSFEIVIKTNFYEALKSLHEEKKKKIKKEKQKDWEEISTRILNQYGNNFPNRINIFEYMRILDEIINSVKTLIPPEDKDKNNNWILVRKFLEKLKSYHLIAVILRELLPPLKSKEEISINVEFFNILLTSAGTQFIEGIPSLHDEVISFGPFQLSEIIEESIKVFLKIKLLNKEGFKKSWRNLWKLPDNVEIEIPQSIKSVDGAWHYVWFIINIIIKLIYFMYLSYLENKKEEEFKKVFEDKIINNEENFMTFIALAHHRPGMLVNFINSLINNQSIVFKDEIPQSYIENIREYAKFLKNIA